MTAFSCARLFSLAAPCMAFLLSTAACATHPRATPELRAARDAYTRAMAGPASMLASSQLLEARAALAEAEAAVPATKANTDRARNLAYVAERRAQLAEAVANKHLAERAQKRAPSTQVALDDDDSDDDDDGVRSGADN